MATFNPSGAYSIIQTSAAIYYLQSLHYFDMHFVDIGTSLPPGPATMANQLSNNVQITGGTIDGTVIGSVNAVNGTFATLTATSFSGSATPSGAAGGDLSGTYPNPTVTHSSIAGGAINGTPIGQTTAAAGAFTTLAASSTVSGTGFSNYMASPPAIGGTAPAAGSFTTLSASSTVSGTGFSSYLASPPAIGGTTAAAGSFTTLSASSTVSGTGFSNYLASPPAIGSTAPSTGKFTSLTDTGLTGNSFVYSGAGGLMASTAAPTNGQLLIGSTGAAPVAATLTGTANQIAITNGAGSITASLPNTLAIPGTVSSVNGVAGVNNGVGVIVASFIFAAQTANLATSTAYTVPAGQSGWYRLHARTVVTTPASGGTPSSTLPNMTVSYTDSDSNGTPSANLGATSTGNTTSTWAQGASYLYAKAGTTITIATNGYATAGTTSMQYDLRGFVVYEGP